jgi:hypothetical protein
MIEYCPAYKPLVKLCCEPDIHNSLICGRGVRNLYDIACAVFVVRLYSASHSRVAPENVGLQKEQKCNTFVCHTCNEVRLRDLGIRKKEVSNTKR